MIGTRGLALALPVAVLLAGSAMGSGASAAPAPDGKALFVSSKCTSCHSIETEKIERKKPEAAEAKADGATASTKKTSDLSGVGAKKDAAWMSKYLMKEVKLDEKLHKTKFRGTPEELHTLCTWMETLKTPAKKASRAGS